MNKINKKSDSFDEKTENSSAPSLENGVNNGFRSGKIAENNAKVVFGLTITTDNYESLYVTMDLVHVVQSYSPRQSNLSNFHNFETIFSDSYDSEG